MRKYRPSLVFQYALPYPASTALRFVSHHAQFLPSLSVFFFPTLCVCIAIQVYLPNQKRAFKKEKKSMKQSFLIGLSMDNHETNLPWIYRSWPITDRGFMVLLDKLYDRTNTKFGQRIQWLNWLECPSPVGMRRNWKPQEHRPRSPRTQHGILNHGENSVIFGIF